MTPDPFFMQLLQLLLQVEESLGNGRHGGTTDVRIAPVVRVRKGGEGCDVSVKEGEVRGSVMAVIGGIAMLAGEAGKLADGTGRVIKHIVADTFQDADHGVGRTNHLDAAAIIGRVRDQAPVSGSGGHVPINKGRGGSGGVAKLIAHGKISHGQFVPGVNRDIAGEQGAAGTAAGILLVIAVVLGVAREGAPVAAVDELAVGAVEDAAGHGGAAAVAIGIVVVADETLAHELGRPEKAIRIRAVGGDHIANDERAIVLIGVHEERGGDLAHVGAAHHDFGLLTCATQRGKQNRDEQCDDGDDDQELYQCEGRYGPNAGGGAFKFISSREEMCQWTRIVKE
jgi:hypothetical protein